jgi:hypothetical protein
MAHMADGTEIVDLAQARWFFRDNDCEELRTDIRAAIGRTGIEIDTEGRVSFVQAGERRFVNDDDMIHLARQLPTS